MVSTRGRCTRLCCSFDDCPGARALRNTGETPCRWARERNGCVQYRHSGEPVPGTPASDCVEYQTRYQTAHDHEGLAASSDQAISAPGVCLVLDQTSLKLLLSAPPSLPGLADGWRT